jgi:hypothetical protein
MSATVIQAPPRPGPRELSAGEAHDFLVEHEWGVLATVGEDGPYAVPVAYAVDGESIVVASGPGEKLRHLLADPRVCLTVAEVADGDRWRCVVVRGVARRVGSWVLGAGEVVALAGDGGTRPTRADLARAARAQVFRVERPRVSGRARGG